MRATEDEFVIHSERMALSRRQLVEASEVQVSNGVAADYFRLVLLHGIGPARYAETCSRRTVAPRMADLARGAATARKRVLVAHREGKDGLGRDHLSARTASCAWRAAPERPKRSTHEVY
jgi:hypothetical protein